MNDLLTFTSKPGAILFFRIFGVCLLITGALTAAFNITLWGLSPTLWILLGLGSFLGAICNTLFAIRSHLESKHLP